MKICIRQDNSPDSKSETGLVGEIIHGFAAAEPGEEGGGFCREGFILLHEKQAAGTEKL